MRIILVVAFFGVCSISYSQISIKEGPEVKELMEKFQLLGQQESTIDGWRIKIVNTTDRREMERVRFKFNQLYPDSKSLTSYENPYYSIRTGAFETRIDAEPMLIELKSLLPTVIPVRDKIEKREIVRALVDGR